MATMAGCRYNRIIRNQCIAAADADAAAECCVRSQYVHIKVHWPQIPVVRGTCVQCVCVCAEQCAVQCNMCRICEFPFWVFNVSEIM